MTKKRGKKAQKNMANSPSTSSPAATTNKESPIDLYAYILPRRPPHALTILISTGDTPGPSDQPNGGVDEPDPTPLRPLPEEPVPPTPEEVKEQGNEAFKSKNYTKAIDLYTQAIGEGHSTT
jgi:hypothetical protein